LPGHAQAAQAKRDNEAMKRAIVQYDEALEAYMPGVPARAAGHVLQNMAPRGKSGV
jgi:hypothetical protein